MIVDGTKFGAVEPEITTLDKILYTQKDNCNYCTDKIPVWEQKQGQGRATHNHNDLI
jgi:hypothetical protein